MENPGIGDPDRPPAQPCLDDDPRVLLHFVEGPEPCAYLGDRPSLTQFVVRGELSPEEYEEKLNQGWRKFGLTMFRPCCEGCRDCRSLRVDVSAFRPTRSQRRSLMISEALTVEVRPPKFSQDRLALFRDYHQAKRIRNGWPAQEIDEESYLLGFVVNTLPALEVSLWEGPHLRGILFLDLTPNVVSAVYHFYDPEMSRFSLGTRLLLEGFALARRLGKSWMHLGYLVRGCRSTRYKSLYRPNQILQPGGSVGSAPSWHQRPTTPFVAGGAWIGIDPAG